MLDFENPGRRIVLPYEYDERDIVLTMDRSLFKMANSIVSLMPYTVDL